MRNFILSVRLARESWYVQQIFHTNHVDPNRMQQMHPPLMDTVTVTAMLYRIVMAFDL